MSASLPNSNRLIGDHSPQLPLNPTWERYWDIFHRNAHTILYRAVEYLALSRRWQINETTSRKSLLVMANEIVAHDKALSH